METTTLSDVLERHRSVFKELGIRRAQGAQSKNNIVDPDAQLHFCKARPVPYAKVEPELDHLEEDGIIEPIQFADWLHLWYRS